MQAAAEELMRAAVGGGERNGEAEVWDDHQGKDDAGGGGDGDGDGGGDGVSVAAAKAFSMDSYR